MYKNMKNRFTPFFIHVLSVGAVALLCQNAQSQYLAYEDTATYSGNNFNFDQGAGGAVEAGNEIVLAGSATSDWITQFQVQIDFTGTGTPIGSVDLSFYQNNGAIYPSGAGANGYASPGTLLYDAGATALTAFTTGGGETLTYTVPSVLVPKDFTYIVTFNGLTATETAGLSIYGAAQIGDNYHDAWVNTGSGYVLQTATGTEPALEFGATASVPEPSTIALGVMGACAFLARRRKS
jgi:hypothetical protein